MTNIKRMAYSLWAKKNVQDGQPMWLPLIVHLMDTKNVIGWLYNHWIDDGQREVMRENFDSEEELLKFVRFLGAVHDIGKATPAFQTKKSYIRDDELDDYLVRRLVESGLDGLDSVELGNRRESPHNLAGEALLYNWRVSEEICAIIGGHHGKPFNFWDVRNQIENYTSNYFQDDNDRNLREKWSDIQKFILDEALNASGYDSLSNLPDKIGQPQAVLFEGLLIMADWLSSSEYIGDNLMFPLINIEDSAVDVDLDSRYHSAIMNWNRDDMVQFMHVSNVESNYEKRWGFKPRNVQHIMSDAIGRLIDPGIIVIEAPMGIGKTEIALTAAEQLGYSSGRDGLYIGLPTQATTNAMFDRVNEWLENIAEEENEHVSIKLMHGKSMFNQTYSNLPHAENIVDEDDDSGTVIVNSWFSGKKSILTKFTVGTIDNLLLMGLKQKHLFLRHFGFSGKVVVIDEAHAYDAYMNSYLYKAIEWLGAYHVPVVVLSATLPKDKRIKLFGSYLRGKFGKWKDKVIFPDNWESEEAYPLLSYLDGTHVGQVTDFGNADAVQKKSVHIHRLDVSDEEIIENVLEMTRDGGIAGIIVNTVKRAQKLAELVPGDVKLMVLHSAFLAPDRAKKEKKLQDTIGKHGNRPQRMIVIGTQVLEQSLDIDFDVLYTDIAPMDLILQRIGRLHRHDIRRPEKLAEPQTYVMGMSEFGDYGDANEGIYGRYLLMKTDYYLKDRINIPEDISPLVQKIYREDDDFCNEGLEKARREFQGKKEKAKRNASAFQIASPVYPGRKGSIHGWLNRDKADVSNSEQRASAAVRDIDETIEVVLLKRNGDDYEILDGGKLSDTDSKRIAGQLIRIPSAVISEYNIDKAIRKLEKKTRILFPEWEDDVWLKGSLAMVLDDNLKADFNGWHLGYSDKCGLSYERNDVD
ncbi:CRISPR-associated helicase Cas3' [uncultured Ligilactobacillus sp.]|uniref:CRISPR-associated helicase Cas3' n=1 Tax=uncultured Ligilactobacillus sp. TaxID=2837633 RepID=UPI00258765F4|nr:CRISPR-associated helicase Cas3' [uncultured Ligilactobacillus sp.]